eukprot:9180460-Alexandrium_andersonii.AAC.1
MHHPICLSPRGSPPPRDLKTHTVAQGPQTRHTIETTVGVDGTLWRGPERSGEVRRGPERSGE